ncbi:cytochrome c oxidase assembly factor CtaG [Sutcliffiella sp. NC1]|uniref:Cytochrome c oxidase assembly factor CtaG n=2 Tax=Sutcliffiella TaxID=2837511 RepID=A0A223KS87_9BACI|nr:MULTISPECIES: cytochrome c oxidase assembly factor CtaG [Sutcliffiella]AST92183.1 cytochrome c oxidase assembly factor CtaG [Sutcliffiella cohnii]WBL13415.1 cytochrome c oxidase assembly factor CtaG [Sutcliffiella sp. NC1]
MLSNLEIFGFRALWSPYFMVSMIIVAILYIYVTGRGRERFEGSEPVSLKQKTFFLLGIALLYFFKGGPIDLLGHLMLSAHMAQMAFLYLIIPPLLILGTPVWLLKKFVNHKAIKPAFNFLTRPLIALISFNALFSFYHIPVIFDVVKTDVTLHTIYTILLFIASFMMWWPLVDPLPEGNKMSGIKKMGYIMADGVLLTPACALIIFADTPLYAAYSDMTAWMAALALCVPASTLAGLDLGGPELFNALPLLEDQQLGGIIMKIIQEIMYGSMLAYVFFQWARKERETDDLDMNPILEKN